MFSLVSLSEERGKEGNTYFLFNILKLPTALTYFKLTLLSSLKEKIILKGYSSLNFTKKLRGIGKLFL